MKVDRRRTTSGPASGPSHPKWQSTRLKAFRYFVGEVNHESRCHAHASTDHVASQPVITQQGHCIFPELEPIAREPRGPLTDAVDWLSRKKHVADHDHQSLRGGKFGAGIVGR